ncbi:MAG TPA: MarR family transcriptional regulator [Dehalococcoidia bacterium]
MLAHPIPGPEFHVLHALMLKRTASEGLLAAATRLEPDALRATVALLAERGLVHAQPDGELVATPEGRDAHAAALRAEMRDEARQRGVLATYRRFLRLNPRVLELASRWQVRTEDGREVPNDHADPDYDRRCVAGLEQVHRRAVPALQPARCAVPRFGLYEVRLSEALHRLRAGDIRYFTGLHVESYHTLWFELHEDLLMSLGLRREQEGRACVG